MNALEAYDVYVAVASLYGHTTVTFYDYRREFIRFYDYAVGQHGLNWDLLSANPKDFHGYMAWSIQQDRKPASVNRSRDALSSLYRTLVVGGHINENPVRHVRKIHSYTLERPFLDDESARLFITSIVDPMIQLAARFFYYTGIRAAELIQLSICHVDLEQGVVTVIGKGRKTRSLPLHKHELLPYLLEYRDRFLKDVDPFTRFFQTRRSGRVSNGTLNKAFQAVSEKLGACQPVTCHVFRHSYATKYLYDGGLIHELQHLLGHEDISTTAKYTHADMTTIQLRMYGTKAGMVNA